VKSHVRDRVAAALAGVATRVHVEPDGDVVVVIPTECHLSLTIQGLASIGYRYEGEVAGSGRHELRAFPNEPRHRLYVVRDKPLPKAECESDHHGGTEDTEGHRGG
jgi:hypothetical protein